MGLSADGLSLTIEPATARLAFRLGGGTVATPAAPRFRLAEQAAMVMTVEPAAERMQVLLAAENVKGRLRLHPCGDAIASVLEIEGAETNKPVEIEVPFRLSGAVHVPEHHRWGARIDAQCPAGREKGVRLAATIGGN